MTPRELTLKWVYANNPAQVYEFRSNDSAEIGHLFRLKVLDSNIANVEVWHGDEMTVAWHRKET